MSQIHLTAHSESENQVHNRNVKQVGVSGIPRSTVKKTALTDVKNILAQRSGQSAKKLPSSTTKPTISKRDLFGVHHDKENISSKKDVGTSEISKNTICSEAVPEPIDENANVHSTCSYCNSVEDDYAFADFMLKEINLTKSKIEKFAVEWEPKTVFGVKDLRPMEEMPEIPPAPAKWLEYDLEMSDLDLDDIPLDIPMVEGLYDSEVEE